MPRFSQGRVGCSTSAQDGETPAAAGMCSRDFCSCYSRRNSNISLKLPQQQPAPVVFALAGKQGRVSLGTLRLSQSPGAACACARGWHQCLFTFSSPDGRALPCCRRQARGLPALFELAGAGDQPPAKIAQRQPHACPAPCRPRSILCGYFTAWYGPVSPPDVMAHVEGCRDVTSSEQMLSSPWSRGCVPARQSPLSSGTALTQRGQCSFAGGNGPVTSRLPSPLGMSQFSWLCSPELWCRRAGAEEPQMCPQAAGPVMGLLSYLWVFMVHVGDPFWGSLSHHYHFPLLMVSLHLCSGCIRQDFCAEPQFRARGCSGASQEFPFQPLCTHQAVPRQ